MKRAPIVKTNANRPAIQCKYCRVVIRGPVANQKACSAYACQRALVADRKSRKAKKAVAR